MALLQEKVSLLFQADINDFIDMSKALYPLGERTLSVKQIICGDIMCNLVDSDIADESLVPHYRELEKKYWALAEKSGYYSEYFAYTAAVCRVAADKIDISHKLHCGYPEDKALLRDVKDQLLPALLQDLEDLKLRHYRLWNQVCRPFGFEIVDARYGGQMNRAKSAMLRLEDYLSGSISRLEELEEKRLPFNGKHKIAHFATGMASGFMVKGY